ncbi:MAG: SAM-dependent methyltransferase [Ignavibacteriae bacterium]|nr:SAM-dependent methyltransferase [Ignavibacteriota bacterium]
MKINSIGKVYNQRGTVYIQLNDEYKSGLTNIDGFSHLQIIWWGNLSEKSKHRNQIIIEKPYKAGPKKIGVFATRSEFRPNPILITTIFVQDVDIAKGRIYTPYIDADDGTPVLDIKPYHLVERVKGCRVPNWCQHWPSWYEEAATFDWENEFNF